MRANLPARTEPVRQAPPRQVEAPRVTTNKQEVDNISESANQMRATQAPAQRPAAVQPRKADKIVGRNEPCPCGSGKKYKNCHGTAE